jgi:hypothetical protein
MDWEGPLDDMELIMMLHTLPELECWDCYWDRHPL